jgi:hypothetical protein
MKKSWRRMGSIVRVLEVYELKKTYGAYGEKTRRRWERQPLNPPRSGWVVGYRTIFDGTVERDSYDDPPYFAIEKAHRCVLVAFTPHTRPVQVPPGGFDEVSADEPQFEMSERDRAELRAMSKDFPRDAHGKFV